MKIGIDGVYGDLFLGIGWAQDEGTDFFPFGTSISTTIYLRFS